MCIRDRSVSPYGAVRIGEKLKNNTGYGNGLFKTSPWDYGLRFATNMRLTSFDFEFGYLLGCLLYTSLLGITGLYYAVHIDYRHHLFFREIRK